MRGGLRVVEVEEVFALVAVDSEATGERQWRQAGRQEVRRVTTATERERAAACRYRGQRMRCEGLRGVGG
jgi:hypothetical protein